MKTIWQMIVILVVGYFSLLFGQVSAHPQAVPTNARCKVLVPSVWGEFVGASNYGLAFKDDQGTIRIMNQMPCGLEGKPNVSLEITRQ